MMKMSGNKRVLVELELRAEGLDLLFIDLSNPHDIGFVNREIDLALRHHEENLAVKLFGNARVLTEDNPL
jgi:hypothetical protein